MITFKLNGKQIQFPSTWFDPTFEQYLGIMESKGDRNKILSLFIGLEYETIRDAKIEGLEGVLMALNFLNEVPKFEGTCEQVGKYKLPINSKGQFNIQFESLAQFEDMRAAMMKVPENKTMTLEELTKENQEIRFIIENTKAYATYVAIYLQKIKDGSYSHQKAIEMIPEVMGMPAHEVIITGGFFFLKLLNLSTGTQASSQNTSPKLKKKKLGSVNSKNRSARSAR